MKFPGKLTGVLLIVAAVAVMGDYLNLPLWPIDRLARNYPVEIQIDIRDVDSQLRNKILSRSQYIKLEICTPDGRLIRQPVVDNRGIARFVLQNGRYSFRAFASVVDGENWHFYAYPRDHHLTGTVVRVWEKETVFTIPLEKNHQLPDGYIHTVFQMVLLDGDYSSALVFSREMPETSQADVSMLLAIQEQLADLPVDAYNSVLSHLEHAGNILSRHGISGNQQVLRIDRQTVYVESRYRAVRQARDRIVSDYLELMHALYASGRLIDVFQQWNQFSGNPEIYCESLRYDSGFERDLVFIEKVIAEYSVLIPDEISMQMQQAVDVYESGDLVKARTGFVHVLSLIQNLSNTPEDSELKEAVIEYIDDIETISAANHAIRMDQLERALFLYDSVVRPNHLVRERILETQRFMRLRGIESSGP